MSSPTMNRAQSAENAQSPSQNQSLQPTQDIVKYVREYARQKPDVAALWCFGIGIVVGWKVKPW